MHSRLDVSLHTVDFESIQIAMRMQEQALRDMVRQLADGKSPKTGVYCYLRAPMGGQSVAFAW